MGRSYRNDKKGIVLGEQLFAGYDFFTVKNQYAGHRLYPTGRCAHCSDPNSFEE